MRTPITIRRLTVAALGLGIAVATAVIPAGSPAALAADGLQGPAGAQGARGVGDSKAVDKQKSSGSGTKGVQNTDADNVDPVTGTEVKKTSVIQYVNAVYVWIAFIGGLLAVISLIYAGYTYMASYGDPEKISNAKDIVEKTLIGLSLLILAALILNTINPRTVSEPCKKDAPGCGDIDFSKPGG